MSSLFQFRASLRWITLGVGGIGGAAFLILVVMGEQLSHGLVAGTLAIGSGLAAFLLARVSDRAVVAELGIAAAFAALFVLTTQWLIPDLEFLDEGQGRPILWLVVFALTTFAFANLGARLGSRRPSQSNVEKGAALGLVTLGLSLGYLLTLTIVARGSQHPAIAGLLAATLLFPALGGLVFQSAYKDRLEPMVFLSAPLLPVTSIAAVIAVRSEHFAEMLAPGLVIFLYLAGASWVGGLLGRRFRSAPPAEPSEIPTARVG